MAVTSDLRGLSIVGYFDIAICIQGEMSHVLFDMGEPLLLRMTERPKC